MNEPGRDRAAIVTGGARRIGRCIVETLHERGLSVLIHCNRSTSEARALADTLNGLRDGSAAFVSADLRDPAAAPRIVGACLEAFGRIDVLVNNASTFYPTPVAGFSEDDWDELVDTNQRAPMRLSAAASEEMGDGSAIVNLVDIHGQVPLAGHAIYAQAKAGLIMQTRALAKDLAPAVRVNAVAPGLILWPEGEGAPDADEKKETLERIPMRRGGEPADVARAVAWLALDADYVTGQVLAVDGGRSLNM
ncbi:MAG: pteridine reductase [Wenzhouxiangellaceae bacterium]|nr:pteridine reductase [Wenzhouxiangellaceae bacterium]